MKDSTVAAASEIKACKKCGSSCVFAFVPRVHVRAYHACLLSASSVLGTKTLQKSSMIQSLTCTKSQRFGLSYNTRIADSIVESQVRLAKVQTAPANTVNDASLGSSCCLLSGRLVTQRRSSWESLEP